MTLRELAQRFKAQAQSATEKVRQLLQAAEVAEFTVYSPPTAKWKSILDSMGLSKLEGKTTCVTCYSTGPEVFDKVETALKKKYKAVVAARVDDAGFRKVFAAGNDPDQEPALVICVNWYEGSREETRAMYSDSSDAPEIDDSPDDLEFDDLDLT